MAVKATRGAAPSATHALPRRGGGTHAPTARRNRDARSRASAPRRVVRLLATAAAARAAGNCAPGGDVVGWCRHDGRALKRGLLKGRGTRGLMTRRRLCRASGGGEVEDQEEEDGARACLRYMVELKKPLGVVLEERKDGAGIFVVEVAEGGAAERDGQIKVGDELIACSGVVFTTSQSYNDVTVRGGEEVVRMSVRGQRFETVMAAIGSHPGNFTVKLELERCDENR